MKLDSSLLRGVEKMGFEKPFPIQERAILPLLKGQDVIGQARTGSGKTAAFSLPMLQSIDADVRNVQGLVLAPTRELAVQIADEMKNLGAYTEVRILTIYGGQSINVQREALLHGVQIVVGTPGRIIDHLYRGWLDLGKVKFVVLDEADTMLDMGFVEDVEFILNQVPASRQMCLFSATMPARITELSRKYMDEPEVVLVDSNDPSVDTLEQYFVAVTHQEKLDFVVSLLQKERPASAIIFCRTKWGAHRLAMDLRQNGFDSVPLHGNLSQRQRDFHMNTFRSGRADVLVATDVASRGIDVTQVACVVNYDIPEDPYLYFHRVGRTARAGRPGKAFSLVSNEEAEDFGRILRMTKTPIVPLRPEDRTHVFSTRRSRRADWRRGQSRPKGLRRWNHIHWRERR